jgi:hypothetical protein
MLRTAFALVGLLFVLGACASAPTGPEYRRAALPTVAHDKAQIIVFREYAVPTALAGKIDVDGVQVFELPQRSFAFLSADPGDHQLALRWPGASGQEGWSGAVVWEAGRTYYYEVSGGLFRSIVTQQQEQVASAKLNACCRLITAQENGVVELSADQPASPTPPRRDLTAEQRANFFAAITAGMSPEQVESAIGPPNDVATRSTGKWAIPFYFGPDTRREYWTYSGIGFVVFTRNHYSASLRVVETRYDADAP